MNRWRRSAAQVTTAVLLAGLIPLTAGTVAADEVTGTVTVGAEPFSATVSPDGARVYVPNSKDDSVSVIDTASNTVTATVSVGDAPVAAAVTPNGARVYVPLADSNSVAVIDAASNTVTGTIPVGVSPRGAAVTPDGAHVYVTNYSSGTVSVISTASNTVTGTIPNVVGPVGVAVAPDGSRAYVTGFDTDLVSVITVATNTVGVTIPVGHQPYGVAVSPSGSRAYVTNNGADTVSVIDTASGSVSATVTVGLRPGGVAVTPDGSRAYVASIRLNTVVVIRTSDNTVTTSIPVGAKPFGVAITPDAANAYVPNYGDGTVSVIAMDRAPSVGSVAITGSAAVGSTLTASAGAVSGFPAPSIEYAWSSGPSAAGPFTRIPGATAATYAPSSSDAGRWLQATATATNTNGTATATSSAVGPVMSLSRVTPARGLTTGGTRVTITGTGFSSGADVRLDGDSAADVQVVSSTTITATTPRHGRGAVDVSVVNPDGQAVTGEGAFSYLTQQKPRRPLGLPASIRDVGWTRLLRVPVTTNAGQKANVRVTLRPTVTTVVPAGDVSLGYVRTFRHHMWVWLSGARPTTVRVTVSAPARPGFTRYLATTAYRTS